MASLLPEGKQSFVGSDGLPLVGGKLYTYDAGTTTPRPTYSDAAGTTPNTNPVIMDSRGEATIFWSGSYKVVLKDAADNTIWSQDNVTDQMGLLAGSSGSSLVGFLAQGAGAVARTLQDKNREFLHLGDFGTVDTSGAVECTSVFNLAATAAAAQGKGLRLPSGTLLLDATSLPATLPALKGRSKLGTVLKFKRQSYSAGQVLLNASSNTAAIELSRFSIDCDSTEFKTAGVYPIALNGSNYAQIERVRVFGRGQTAVFTNSMVGGRIRGLTIDCTGTAGNSFSSGFYGQNCLDVVVDGMRTSGLPQYAGVFGATSLFVKFVNCHTDGTSGAFGYSLGGCSYSHIVNCTAKNTSHEAYQLTDCYYCTIAYNSAQWEAGSGVDAGISIHGNAGQARLNKVIGNTLINSYASGLLCADNAQYNLFADNILRDCAVRGTAAAGVGTFIAAMGQYTANAGITCTGNTFRGNKVLTESGTVTYGFAEFNNGAGSSITNTRVLDNEFQGGSTVTTRYLLVSASSEVADVDFQTFAPTITPAAGAITSYAVNSARYRKRGGLVEMTLDITITNAGTGSGALTILFNNSQITAAANGGTLSGKENGVTAKLCGGICNSGGVVVLHADATTVIATNARIVLSGIYRTA